ncbi:MAG: hypothetical protein KIT69_10735 [Propionibacteriaceae bacterium]|nr:hypothetical protein [Propionibacteriaceae bacterium]
MTDRSACLSRHAVPVPDRVTSVPDHVISALNHVIPVPNHVILAKAGISRRSPATDPGGAL